jgi:hypothetical protein
MVVKVPDWKLESFSWLAVDRWTPEYLLADYVVEGKRYCKVCDTWVLPVDEKKHVASHVKQWREIKKKQAADAKRAREEGKKRAAAERKRLRDAGLS